MNAVLNVAANVSKYYSDKGDEVEIQIVAFNAGLHMLREDTSPVKERIANFRKSMSNVAFKACGNTMDTMERNEGHPIRLLPQTDPLSRQITIGHGAFLELLSIAASVDGYRTEVAPYPASFAPYFKFVRTNVLEHSNDKVPLTKLDYLRDAEYRSRRR